MFVFFFYLINMDLTAYLMYIHIGFLEFLGNSIIWDLETQLHCLDIWKAGYSISGLGPPHLVLNCRDVYSTALLSSWYSWVLVLNCRAGYMIALLSNWNSWVLVLNCRAGYSIKELGTQMQSWLLYWRAGYSFAELDTQLQILWCLLIKISGYSIDNSWYSIIMHVLLFRCSLEVYVSSEHLNFLHAGLFFVLLPFFKIPFFKIQSIISGTLS